MPTHLNPTASIINTNPISLENIGRGNLVARFNQAMKDILANIRDENTSLKKREIIIKVIIAPSPDRDTAEFGVSVTAKPEPIIPYQSALVIGQDIYGECEAHEAMRAASRDSPAQQTLSCEPDPGADAGPGAESDSTTEAAEPNEQDLAEI